MQRQLSTGVKGGGKVGHVVVPPVLGKLEAFDEVVGQVTGHSRLFYGDGSESDWTWSAWWVF